MNEGDRPFQSKIIVRIDGEIREFVPNYLLHRSEEIPLLREALAAGDFARVEHLGHRMRGSGHSYGFDEITAIGIKIEAEAKVKNSVEIQTCIERLESYLKNLEVTYI